MHAPQQEHYQSVTQEIGDSGERLSQEQFTQFWTSGWVGPLRCSDPSVSQLETRICEAGVLNAADDRPVPPRETWGELAANKINVGNPHLGVPAVQALAGTASIVNPVAQVLGTSQVEFFQSRYRVKLPGKPDIVPWHQDVGRKNGGFRPDGMPVPSLTVWLSLDGAPDPQGSLRVVPGTHTQLFGNWSEGYASKLRHRDIGSIDTGRSVALEAEPGEFYIMHSWLLHITTENLSSETRSALVLRYVAPQDALQEGTEYTTFRAD